jgi:transposase, IS30 family
MKRESRGLSSETVYTWIYRRGQKAGRLWQFLTRRRVRRRKRHDRASRDTSTEKVRVSQRADDADARETSGHWVRRKPATGSSAAPNDLIICKHSRPVLVLHERKSRITLMTRLAGKTAGETVAAFMAIIRRLDPRMRGSITLDNDTRFARHTLLRGMLSTTTYFCDAYARRRKGGVENATARIRRWLPRKTDLDALTEDDIQEIAMTITLTPRKCLGYRSPVAAFLGELGRRLEIRFA